MSKTIVKDKAVVSGETQTIARVLPLTIKGGTNGDDVFPGTGGNDTFDGGNGNDTIYGAGGDDVLRTGNGSTGSFDRAFGGDGSDTLYGGADVDTLFGGAGNDVIYNTGGHSNGEIFNGDAGDDVLILQLSNLDQAIVVKGGPDDASDGNDFVQVSGRYEIVKASLGNGHDVYIGGLSAEQAQDGANSDVVNGGMGNDAISAWYGDDVIDGGEGDDVLWGGAGDDTVLGGDGADILYGGTEKDLIDGGAGGDLYYWSREDGNDQIYDQFRNGGSGQDNGLLVFGVFGPDGELISGTGVFESDFDVMDSDGMVMISDAPDDKGGTDLWQLEIISGAGKGSVVIFDPRDVPVIGLGNHDAPAGSGLQIYTWNGSAYVYQENRSFDDMERGVNLF